MAFLSKLDCGPSVTPVKTGVQGLPTWIPACAGMTPKRYTNIPSINLPPTNLPMTNLPTYQLIVIGGGPAGSTAALRGRELGASVALIERGASAHAIGAIGRRALK